MEVFHLLQLATEFSVRHHRHQVRFNGSPYVAHPFRVSLTLGHLFGIDDAYDNLWDAPEQKVAKAMEKADRAIVCAGDDEGLAKGIALLRRLIEDAPTASPQSGSGRKLSKKWAGRSIPSTSCLSSAKRRPRRGKVAKAE